MHGVFMEKFFGDIQADSFPSPFDCTALFLRSLPFHPPAPQVSPRFCSRFSRFPFLPARPLNPSLHARSAKLRIIAYTWIPCLSTSIHFSVSCLSLRLRRMISMQRRKSAFILYLQRSVSTTSVLEPVIDALCYLCDAARKLLLFGHFVSSRLFSLLVSYSRRFVFPDRFLGTRIT